MLQYSNNLLIELVFRLTTGLICFDSPHEFVLVMAQLFPILDLARLSGVKLRSD